MRRGGFGLISPESIVVRRAVERRDGGKPVGADHCSLCGVENDWPCNKLLGLLGLCFCPPNRLCREHQQSIAKPLCLSFESRGLVLLATTGHCPGNGRCSVGLDIVSFRLAVSTVIDARHTGTETGSSSVWLL